MANTTIKALIGFSNGTTSLGVGDVASIDSTKASDYISGGLAEAYTKPIVPSGTLEVTANGTYDVTEYASASVTVE